uniref:Terpene synthase 10 n=1 Tax=Aquilaria sinensis TaxID=210372 RepID=A0A8E8AS09_9ROSI|nr:terpene synthase 10 [Aquilaria sinensis]WBO38686.1 terpene synthase 15 [Aquilaria agallochum]
MSPAQVVLPVSAQTQNTAASEEANRRSAGYHPSFWGEFFLTHSSEYEKSDATVQRKHEELQQQVRRMVMDPAADTSKKLELIDATLRLGVGYRFEGEIESELEKIHSQGTPDCDLYTACIWFRVLRGQGFTVSADVFTKLKNKDGGFDAKDAQTLLCLYETTHLRIQGEQVLEEALDFSTKQLEALLPELSSPLAEYVKNSLELPYHKGMQRLEARQYIPIYEAYSTKNDALLHFAKLDFNLLQALHQSEIREITRWWKDLDFKTRLSYARDRLVECYFWILGVQYEPQYSMSRIFLTKVISLASVFDDTYDIYGTFDELKLLTAAVDRWEPEATDSLPGYMQILYGALSEVFEEYKDMLINAEGRDYCLYYGKEAMKGLVRSYHTEAVSFHTGHVQNFEEYLDNSAVSSGYPMLTVEALIGMGAPYATKEALDWALKVPRIIKASSDICRLVDDLRTYKVEEERGDAPSGVHCYMKDYNVSEEEACERIKEMIDLAWKAINEEIQKPNHLPLPVLLPALNFARMMEVLYQNIDGYTNSGGRTKERITSLLVHPVTI